VDPKLRARFLLALLAIICGGAVWGVVWYRGRPIKTAALLKRMPLRDAVVLYVDFDALRRGGILQLLDGSKAGEDADYQSFVRKTNFDYKEDLDSAMLAFTPSGRYLLIRGRFDWKSLREYAQGEGGECYASVCRMTGSTPDRHISFMPLQSNLMALAVSPDDSAVQRLGGTSSGPAPEVPDAPIWLSLPNSVLKSGDNLPAGTRMFAHSMEQAQQLTLSLVPESSRFAAKLDLRCRSTADANSIASDLNRITNLLKEMIEREQQKPNPADLSGVLTSGSFRAEGPRVWGHWPIERTFINNMLSGSMN
jgi:hypothetical protein